MRTEAVVGIAYESDVETARAVALDALRSTEGVRDEPEPLVLVAELGVSTVDLQLLFWTAPQQRFIRITRDRVLTAVRTALEEAGVEMPADIVVLQGTPSRKAALGNDDDAETTQAGSVRAGRRSPQR